MVEKVYGYMISVTEKNTRFRVLLDPKFKTKSQAKKYLDKFTNNNYTNPRIIGITVKETIGGK